MAQKIQISVIICTYDRKELLNSTLDSLGKQNFPLESFEVIIVDDGSSDGTEELCNSFKRTFLNFKYVKSRHSGLSHSRNIGIQHAQGNFILFTDDDCIVDKNWIKNFALNHGNKDIISGAINFDSRNYWSISHHISQFSNMLPRKRSGKTKFLAGANMGIKKGVFETIKWFDEKFERAQDMEFGVRAQKYGHMIYFEPRSIVRHHPPVRCLRDILTYSWNHAKYTIQIRLKYSDILNTPILLKKVFLLMPFSPLISLWATIRIFIKNKELLKYWYTAPTIFALKLAWCFGAIQALHSKKDWSN